MQEYVSQIQGYGADKCYGQSNVGQYEKENTKFVSATQQWLG